PGRRAVDPGLRAAQARGRGRAGRSAGALQRATAAAAGVHPARRQPRCEPGPRVPHRGTPGRTRGGGAGQCRERERRSAPVPQPLVRPDVRAGARAQPHARWRRRVLEKRTPAATGGRRVKPCPLAAALLAALALSSGAARADGPAPAHVVLSCEAVYLPARSTWTREVRFTLDERRIRGVEVDGVPVYSFSVFDT